MEVKVLSELKFQCKKCGLETPSQEIIIELPIYLVTGNGAFLPKLGDVYKKKKCPSCRKMGAFIYLRCEVVKDK